jgi:hypothetical protein
VPGISTDPPLRSVADGHRAGPCERHLLDAVARFAPLLRAAVIGLCGVFWLTGHAGVALPLAITILVVATVLACAQSRWHAAAPVTFMTANAVLSVVVGLSQVVFGAQPISGWVYAMASIMSVTCYVDWPERPVAGHLLAAVTIGAHSAGYFLAAGFVPAVAVWSLLVQAGLSWTGLLLVRHAARLCDRLVRRSEQRRIAAAAVRAQRTADRAYLAMLHDTASTTLLMVSTGATGDFDWLPAAARRDLEVLTAHLPVTDRDSDLVDLAELLTSLTGYPGLTVRVDVDGPLTVPPTPAYAIYHGVREALSNVQRHAGDPRPVLTARERDGRVVVRLSDRGRGFDPAAVPAQRRGLAESIQARMTAAGGVAEVRSAPGQGTTVEWTWSRG